MKLSDKIIIGFLSIMLFYSVLNIFIRKENDKNLEDGFNITSGKITDFGFVGGRTSAPPEFKFIVDNKEYRNTFSSSYLCKGKRPSKHEGWKIQRNSFPVIFKPDNPSINKILLHRADFNRYGLAYPDSLAPVLEKWFECD